MWALVVSVVLSQVVASDPRAEARRLFVEGEARFQAHAWDDATTAFRASFVLRPSAATAWNLAQCAELSNQPAASIGWYRRYLWFDPAVKDKPQVERAIRAQEKKLAARLVQAVTVFVSPSDAVAVIDDAQQLIDGATIELSPGRHRVLVSAPGFIGAQLELDLSPTASKEISVKLEVAPRPSSEDEFAQLPPMLSSPPDAPTEEASNVAQPIQLKQLPPYDPSAQLTSPGLRPHRFGVTWVGAGLTIASVLTAVIAGSVALSASSQLRDGQVRAGSAANALTGQATTAATVANAGWIAAGVSAVGAAIALGIEW